MEKRYCIEVLENEHENIVRLTKVMKEIALDLMNKEPANTGDIDTVTEIIKNYSDAHHHGKEELILFQMMIDEIGGAAVKLVKNGMIVEHELARMYNIELGQALEELKKEDNDRNRLEVIGHLMEYANLLQKHAEKENTVVYPFALRMLKEETLDKADEETKEFEKNHEDRKETLLRKLNNLENKYHK